VYHHGNRQLQERYDTARIADRIVETYDVAAARLTARQREFIERADMFFIATADEQGHPNCSYKGGEPGFVSVVDEHTIAFPNYDGNGMYLTAGNVLVNAHVGLLFISFVEQARLRLNGVASHDEQDELLARYPEAQFVTRVRATEVFPNCPRYIHRYELVQRSAFVPKEGARTPVPAWKCSDWAVDALPEGDPALEPGATVVHKG
jgi:predicted pyridoxine 5'-phosphate oxidase superfamily flavin-nucleotide-binding protein